MFKTRAGRLTPLILRRERSEPRRMRGHEAASKDVRFAAPLVQSYVPVAPSPGSNGGSHGSALRGPFEAPQGEGVGCTKIGFAARSNHV